MSAAVKLVCLAPAETAQLALQPAAMPSPRRGQVVVRVEATSVNPIDVKRAGGYGQRLLRLKGAGTFPLVLGNDLVGVVESVGDGVIQWRPGDRVMGLLPTGKGGGAHASHVAVDADLLRPAIAAAGAETLAVFPYSFTTVWLSLKGAGLDEANTKGLQVLIHGASGGLGQLALQVLTGWGASVTAICGTDNVEACRRLGAASVWDRARSPLTKLPDHFDAALNFAAWSDEEILLGKLKPTALGYATTVHPLLANFDRDGLVLGGLRSRREFRRMRRIAAAKGARYQWVIFRPDREALDVLHEFLSRGRLTLEVGIAATLQDAGAAFDHVARRKAGRAALRLLE